MVRTAPALVVLTATLLLLVTSGCGGGGKGSDLPLVQLRPPEFTGDYHYLALGGTTPPSTIEEVFSEFGTARPDHAGGVTLNWRSNVNGSPEPPAISDLTTYDVQPDGSFRWFVPASGGAPLLEGGLRRDGNVGILDDGSIAILGGTAHPGRPYLAAFVRYHESGGLNDATLSGTYHVVSFTHTPAGYASTYGTFTSNGSGYGAMITTGKAESVVLPSTTASGTYSVNEHGELDLNLSSGDVLEGGVSADGTFACLAAGMTATMVVSPQIWLLVKR